MEGSAGDASGFELYYPGTEPGCDIKGKKTAKDDKFAGERINVRMIL
jgi:hypothetical protein